MLFFFLMARGSSSGDRTYVLLGKTDGVNSRWQNGAELGVARAPQTLQSCRAALKFANETPQLVKNPHYKKTRDQVTSVDLSIVANDTNKSILLVQGRSYFATLICQSLQYYIRMKSWKRRVAHLSRQARNHRPTNLRFDHLPKGGSYEVSCE